ncbi:MAG: hypothetical protein FJY65_07735 [Calditrichaeota bacterium]|nr:hypothetical protein [Calditrichota bacterium]
MNRRALSHDAARDIRKRGHDDALEFALAIGLPHDYQNDIKAKKDVIDLSGDAHSLKSGFIKWQIFLYSLNRFQTDEIFQAMNGIGDLLCKCILAFPEEFDDYERYKNIYKQELRIPMRELAIRFQRKSVLKAFMNKSMFNAGEVNFLTVKEVGCFHIFTRTDVLRVLTDNLEVCNSKAITSNQTPEQKVLFRFEGTNLGELEMRNDSIVHYREIRFNMIKKKVMKLLFDKIRQVQKYNDRVLLYGEAIKTFHKSVRNK